jgi:diadenosine tetraphosphatase ApaH/serine/threonine PP2A family protein phosphatase
MRIAVLSDLHANGDALDAVVRELERRMPDRVYHLGDLTGYNSEPERCVRWAMESTDGGVYGNHDAVACGRATGKDFHEAARRAALWSRERLSAESRAYLAGLPSSFDAGGCALLVHGSPCDPDRYIYSIDQAMEEMESPCSLAAGDDPVFFGHTHVAGGFVRRRNGVVESVPPGRFRLGKGERSLLNPGSVGQPRDRDPDASFLLYDPERREVEWVRVPYDIEAARRKVLAAGLPPFFADRLRDGT